jgi:hypothetical protein
MTIRWAELKRFFQTDPWGMEGPEGPRAKMALIFIKMDVKSCFGGETQRTGTQKHF